MAKRNSTLDAFLLAKRDRPKNGQRAAGAPVFDARATQLAKGVVPATVLVPDVRVDENTGVRWNLKVIRNLRRDPIGAMEARGQLEIYQIDAARHWQELHEASQVGGGIKAMDTTKDPVDGGGLIPDPITDRQRKALAEIHRADVVLGSQGSALVRHVLADCLSIGQIAEMYGVPTARERDRLGWMFRKCLDELAKCYGKADRRLASCHAPGV
jgi:hypothetical protein